MSFKVSGLGGAFIYANDPEGLGKWYAEVLGLVPDNPSEPIYYIEYKFLERDSPQTKASVSWAILKAKEKFERTHPAFIINYRVKSMDEFIKHLDSLGIEYKEVQEYPEGKFTLIKDPENNSLEIWEPSEKFMS